MVFVKTSRHSLLKFKHFNINVHKGRLSRKEGVKKTVVCMGKEKTKEERRLGGDLSIQMLQDVLCEQHLRHLFPCCLQTPLLLKSHNFIKTYNMSKNSNPTLLQLIF
jgi:hypothetical protein